MDNNNLFPQADRYRLDAVRLLHERYIKGDSNREREIQQARIVDARDREDTVQGEE